MLSDFIRVCCNTPANQPHLPDCDRPVEPLPEQQESQGVDIDDNHSPEGTDE